MAYSLTKMKKDNQKCVRMNNEVLRIVESYHGDGFNQKFENLVTDFKKTLPEREACKNTLDDMINDRKKKLSLLTDSLDKAEKVKVLLKQMIETLEI